MAIIFPALPPAKTYGELMTPEQEILQKLIDGHNINAQEEAILSEAISYYKELYPFLKSIDLSALTQEEADNLIVFLCKAINMDIYPKNAIYFQRVFRMTYVTDKFLQDGKVRDISFIKNPPLCVIKEQGIYGRANTPKSTVFYCALHYPGVAILETIPQKGDRIIIAEWHKTDAKPFISAPVTNIKTIDNESLKAATQAFRETLAYNHPLFAEIMEMYFDFFSSELVKKSEIKHLKKFEYLYSGFFSDCALGYGYEKGQNEKEKTRNVDCLIYPSVANNHKSENLAIVPESLTRLKPVKLHDGIVMDTKYDNADISNGNLPIIYKQLREAIQFDETRIIWNDD